MRSSLGTIVHRNDTRGPGYGASGNRVHESSHSGIFAPDTANPRSCAFFVQYRVQTCHGSFLVAASAAAPMVAAAVPAATAPAIGCKARKNTCQCQHSSTSPAKAGDAKSLSPRNVSRDKRWRRGCKEEAPPGKPAKHSSTCLRIRESTTTITLAVAKLSA